MSTDDDLPEGGFDLGTVSPPTKHTQTGLT
jgi:hypothetical protein